MPLVTFNWSPETRILRQFGWIACAVGLLLGAFAWSGWAAAAAFGAGTFSALASLIRPALNRPLFIVLSAVAYPIGFVVSLIVLTVLFYGVITPVALLLKVSGHDPLARRIDRAAGSYWVESRPPRPKQDYFRQY